MKPRNARHRQLAGKLLAAAILIPLVVLLLFPLLQLVSFATDVPADRWSLLIQTYIPPYASNTLILVLAGGFICLLWGLSCAWITTNFKFPGRKQLSWLLILPLACPVYITGIVYSDLFAGIFINFHGIPAASIIFGSALYPYVYIFSRFAMREQSVDYIRAAQTMGLSRWQILRRILLPLALPFVSFGLLLAVIEIINDYGLVNYYSVNTIALGIYNVWLGLNDFNGSVLLALFAIGLLLLIFVAETYLLSKRPRYEGQSRHSPLEVVRLPRGKGLLCLAWCLLPLTVGFILPVALLLSNALMGLDALGGIIASDLMSALYNTLFVLVSVIVLAVLCSLAINFSARHLGKPWQLLGQSVNICYTLPGTLLAFTCIIFVTRINQELPLALQISGILVLVVACTIRYSPPANRSIHNTLQKMTPSLEMAARIFSESKWRMFSKVHFPLLKSAILLGSLIIFIEVIKELPLVLLLRPFNFETLASFAYQYASDSRLAVASIPALGIILVSTPILYWLNRLTNNLRQEVS